MEVRKNERFPTNLQGRYRCGNGLAKDVAVTDLSTSGCKFHDKFCNLAPNACISIRIGNIGPLNAWVRWVKNKTVGVQFEQALHDSVLDHMRTTLPQWQPDDESTAPAAMSVKEPDHLNDSAIERITISVKLRPPTIKDVKDAMAELQMQLPIMTEVEILAIFNEILNRVFVASESD